MLSHKGSKSLKLAWRRRAALGAKCALVAATMSFSAASSAVPAPPLDDYGELPAGVQKVVSASATPQERSALLAGQPDLVLDHQILRLRGTPRIQNLYITVNHLRLLHGSQIVTQGLNVQITAVSIESDGGSIVSFESPVSSSPADAGANGRSGLEGGTLVLDTELADHQALTVNLAGQDGQRGGDGVRGVPGIEGSRGEDAADHILDCAHGAGNGGTGGKGGPGGPGGSGGHGGSGGKLLIRSALISQREQISFSAPGGEGGKRGDGGPGGPGGQGGPGGRRTTWCGDGHKGATGPIGDTGAQGDNDGAAGAAGRLLAD